MKPLLYILMFVILSSVVFGVSHLTTGLEAVFAFDNLTDSTNRHNLTGTAGIVYSLGKNGNCVNLSGTTQSLNITTAKLAGTVTGMSISWWMYPHGLVDQNRYIAEWGTFFTFGYFGGGAPDHWFNWWPTAVKPSFGDLGLWGTVPTNQWTMVTAVWNTSGNFLYKNGTIDQTDYSGNVPQTLSLGEQTIGDLGTSAPGRYWDGCIDEMYVWFNRSLNASSVADLWAGGAGNFYSNFSAEAPGVDIINFSLKNNSGAVLANPVEGELFRVNLNATYGGAPSTTLNCSYRGYNISEQFADISGSNYTIYGAFTYGYSSVMHLNESVVADYYRFRVCKNGASSKFLEVYVKNMSSPVILIQPVTVPLCSLGGFHEETIRINSSFTLNGNITVACSNCTTSAGGYTMLSAVMNFGNNYTRAVIDRWYLYHNDSMSYNSSTGLYADDDYYNAHYFFQDGSNMLTGICNGTSENFMYNSATFNVSASFFEIDIDGESFSLASNGSTFNAGTNYTIYGDCFGGLGVSNATMSLSYNNGTSIASRNEDFLVLTKYNITENGKYLLNLTCNSTDSYFFISRSFNITDNATPVIVMIFPLADNSSSSITNNTVLIDFVATDPNLYKVNVSCNNSLGVSIVSNETVVYPTSPYQFQRNTSAITVTGNNTCTVCASDAHTAKLIPDIAYEIVNNTVVFRHSSAELTLIYSDNTAKDALSVQKTDDRYLFTPNSKFGRDVLSTLTYEVSCSEELFFVNKSRYNAHFICGDLWIDFNMAGLERKDYKIVNLAGNRYRVDISNVKNAPSLTTSSIGILNTLCIDVRFVTYNPATAEAGGDDNMNLTLIILWGMLVAFGFFAPLFLVASGFVGIFLSFIVLMQVSTAISMIFLVLNACIIIMGFFMLKE